MSKKKYLCQAVAAALFAASGACNVAFAVGEIEPNDSSDSPQRLVIGTDGTARVDGSIGVENVSDTPLPDVDLYSFEGKEGDLVTLDIDGGFKVTPTTKRHVDTIIAIFKPGSSPGSFEKLEENDTPVDFTVDEGSVPVGGVRDARIDNPPLRLPQDGTYIVGVSSYPRWFDISPEGKIVMLSDDVSSSWPNGTYTLHITGVTPPVAVPVPPPPPAPPAVQYISINIKPGSGVGVLNPKAKGSIPIALLSSRATASSPEFKALEVKRDSLTFGRTGDEPSLLRCNKVGADVNDDGLPDLVCHFDNELARFEASDRAGIAKGQTADGRLFEGRGDLKVKPPISKK